MQSKLRNLPAEVTAQDEGAAAFREGKSASANPYPRGLVAGIAWRRGWEREFYLRNASGK